MGLKDLTTRIESLVPDPREGLPQEVFQLVSRLTPLVNVDLLIQDDAGRTLLTWRDDEFPPPGWHVPGGIIRFKETAAARIAAVAAGELRAEVACVEGPLAIHELINSGLRTTRGHFISLLYRCRLTTPLDPARRHRPENPRPDGWEWHAAYPPDMIPGHHIYRRFF
jgi:ADP-ribose pyrophosphatase YjhB (NUDIX family)